MTLANIITRLKGPTHEKDFDILPLKGQSHKKVGEMRPWDEQLLLFTKNSYFFLNFSDDPFFF
jgi:hypothetical protein